MYLLYVFVRAFTVGCVLSLGDESTFIMFRMVLTCYITSQHIMYIPTKRILLNSETISVKLYNLEDVRFEPHRKLIFFGMELTVNILCFVMDVCGVDNYFYSA